MKIELAKKEDLNVIFQLYDMATSYQKTVYEKQWEGFEPSLIESEIDEHRFWKICKEERVICVFSINFNDALFWREKDKQPSIYIHRIALHDRFRGQSIMQKIMNWAHQYAKENAKEFIRMDTWGENFKLINYYKKCGFTHLETIDLDNTSGLPQHYKGKLALLEMKVK